MTKQCPPVSPKDRTGTPHTDLFPSTYTGATENVNLAEEAENSHLSASKGHMASEQRPGMGPEQNR